MADLFYIVDAETEQETKKVAWTIFKIKVFDGLNQELGEQPAHMSKSLERAVAECYEIMEKNVYGVNHKSFQIWTLKHNQKLYDSNNA